VAEFDIVALSEDIDTVGEAAVVLAADGKKPLSSAVIPGERGGTSPPSMTSKAGTLPDGVCDSSSVGKVAILR
jgi:hypothetical protein